MKANEKVYVLITDNFSGTIYVDGYNDANMMAEAEWQTWRYDTSDYLDVDRYVLVDNEDDHGCYEVNYDKDNSKMEVCGELFCTPITRAELISRINLWRKNNGTKVIARRMF